LNSTLGDFDAFQEQARTWAEEVDAILPRTSRGRMIAEWAKKPERWDRVRNASDSTPIAGIPGLR
jgi:hypothetical protein